MSLQEPVFMCHESNTGTLKFLKSHDFRSYSVEEVQFVYIFCFSFDVSVLVVVCLCHQNKAKEVKI